MFQTHSRLTDTLPLFKAHYYSLHKLRADGKLLWATVLILPVCTSERLQRRICVDRSEKTHQHGQSLEKQKTVSPSRVTRVPKGHVGSRCTCQPLSLRVSAPAPDSECQGLRPGHGSRKEECQDLRPKHRAVLGKTRWGYGEVPIQKEFTEKKQTRNQKISPGWETYSTKTNKKQERKLLKYVMLFKM